MDHWYFVLINQRICALPIPILSGQKKLQLDPNILAEFTLPLLISTRYHPNFNNPQLTSERLGILSTTMIFKLLYIEQRYIRERGTIMTDLVRYIICILMNYRSNII